MHPSIFGYMLKTQKKHLNIFQILATKKPKNHVLLIIWKEIASTS
jgi:hypothetical protein